MSPKHVPVTVDSNRKQSKSTPVHSDHSTYHCRAQYMRWEQALIEKRDGALSIEGILKCYPINPGDPNWILECFCLLVNDCYQSSWRYKHCSQSHLWEREHCFIDDKKWVYFEHAFELFHQFSYISACETLKCPQLLRRRFPSPRTPPPPVRSVTPLWLELKCS